MSERIVDLQIRTQNLELGYGVIGDHVVSELPHVQQFGPIGLYPNELVERGRVERLTEDAEVGDEIIEYLQQQLSVPSHVTAAESVAVRTIAT